MMKMLVLTNLYPPHYLGGYELICHMVVNELCARGHHARILTSHHAVPGRVHSNPEPAIERTLRLHGFYGHPWLNAYRLRHVERHNNHTLLAAIARHQPDLVYVWNMGGLSKSMIFSLQKLGVPTVFYLSDHWIARGFESDVWLRWWNHPDAGWKTRYAREFAKWTGARRHWQRIAPTNPPRHACFQRICFCSKALRKLTAAAGFDVMHGAVIYAPVDIQEFTGPVKTAFQPMRKLLWVGRLAPDKGPRTALEAMRHLAGKRNLELALYGTGDSRYAAELKEFARLHELPARFSAASRDQMPRIYREHDALLFTSEWPEPFALTPLEAMASGLPVIATTTGGSREIFRHGDNALTYTAGNAIELAERITELATNHALRARLAAAGQSEVRRTYALPLIVDQIEAYLNETISSWKPQGLPRYAT